MHMLRAMTNPMNGSGDVEWTIGPKKDQNDPPKAKK